MTEAMRIHYGDIEFVVGRRYLVLRDWQDFGFPIHKGDVLVYRTNYYSHYDGAFVFEFRRTPTELVQWWVADTDSPDVWRTVFEEIAG